MNPFKKETMKAKQEKEKKEFLDKLDAAVRVDPENKHGAW